jgi:hypothetical protein
MKISKETYEFSGMLGDELIIEYDKIGKKLSVSARGKMSKVSDLQKVSFGNEELKVLVQLLTYIQDKITEG